MDIVGKILLFLAFMIMPVGIFLAAQGGYFYTVTSKQSVSGLIDSVISDLFQSQIAQFMPYCQMLNISCSNFSEMHEQVCEKSHELRLSTDNVAKAECSNSGLTCSNMESAAIGFCNLLGNGSSQCIQLKSSTEQLLQYEGMCSQMDGIEANITAAKDIMYEQDIVENPFPISMRKVNNAFANSVLIGVFLVIISSAMAYLPSRNIFVVAKCAGASLLTMGLFCAAFGFFGYPIINEVLPSGTALPSSLESFVAGIFSFEVNTGIIMAILGAIILAASFILAKKYPVRNESEPKKKAKK